MMTQYKLQATTFNSVDAVYGIKRSLPFKWPVWHTRTGLIKNTLERKKICGKMRVVIGLNDYKLALTPYGEQPP